MSAWLEQRLARGHEHFADLVTVADRDPDRALELLADRQRVPDDAIAEVLSAGLSAGLPHQRFPRLVRVLAEDLDDESPPGMVKLPPLRRLLWAVAVALANLAQIEHAVEDGDW